MKDLYQKVTMESEQSTIETEDPFYDDFPWFGIIGRFGRFVMPVLLSDFILSFLDFLLGHSSISVT